MDVTEFRNLKNIVLKLDQKNNQLIGAKESLIKFLKEEFNLNSIEEAQKKLKQLKKENEELEEECNELLENLIKDLKKEGIVEDED
jgi:predicted nuclease with TOPRIM domain